MELAGIFKGLGEGWKLLVAMLFFAFTATMSKSPVKKKQQNTHQQAQQQAPDHPKVSVTPLRIP